MAQVCTLKTVSAALLLCAGLSCGSGNDVSISPGPGQGSNNGNGSAAAGGGSSPPPVVGLPTDGVVGTGGTNGGSNPPGQTPTEGENCGIENFAPQRQPAELLLVFDRSGSMSQGTTPGQRNTPRGMTKWDLMTSALRGVVEKTQADVHWGLKFFPTDGNCAVEGTAQAPVPNAYASISSWLTRVSPGGGTPTTAAVRTAVEYIKTLQTPNPKYIVLATDGLPTCRGSDGQRSGADDAAAIEAIGNAATAGVPVFVVGIALEGADLTLNEMAVRGGRPRNDPAKKYYPTTNAEEFTAALSTIASSVASCVYGLGQPIAANIPIAVEAGGMRLVEGTDWVFGSNRGSVELIGATCERITSGALSNVKVLKGCPGKLIP